MEVYSKEVRARWKRARDRQLEKEAKLPKHDIPKVTDDTRAPRAKTTIPFEIIQLYRSQYPNAVYVGKDRGWIKDKNHFLQWYTNLEETARQEMAEAERHAYEMEVRTRIVAEVDRVKKEIQDSLDEAIQDFDQKAQDQLWKQIERDQNFYEMLNRDVEQDSDSSPSETETSMTFEVDLDLDAIAEDAAEKAKKRILQWLE